VTITNRGAVASGPFNIQWIADATIFLGGQASLAPGESVTYDHIWQDTNQNPTPIPPGRHALTFTADSGNTVAETNEKNNQITLKFSTKRCGSS
jgi:subtilase family serine protease